MDYYAMSLIMQLIVLAREKLIVQMDSQVGRQHKRLWLDLTRRQKVNIRGRWESRALVYATTTASVSISWQQGIKAQMCAALKCW